MGCLHFYVTDGNELGEEVGAAKLSLAYCKNIRGSAAPVPRELTRHEMTTNYCRFLLIFCYVLQPANNCKTDTIEQGWENCGPRKPQANNYKKK